ncbi:hypothetical protein I2F27_03600 [Acinetobacter sp. B5B]|uniref:hypothetical protein n=1 Tax=Acinetobacter baretiae TaxID=2605383 RepID=UPI0018C2643E|nr:hypothetical protein [Acinetobacter baretiae]MBF7682416.1 hypothetical protein [Acinetobacter baretiae]MBF7685316.1 hypothetical protein [Acinetobacter baretiae]
MQNSTLFLIQSDYANTPIQLQRLGALLKEHDHIVVMGEAILHLHLIPSTHPIYVLENEKILLHTNQSQVINYTELADLILQHEKVIRIS